MKERTVTVTLDEAREWFNDGNATLKKIALQAFNEDELVRNFKNITTFKKACEALNLNYASMSVVIREIAMTSIASAAMFKMNIVRKALNLGYDWHLAKGTNGFVVYYPCNPFISKNSDCYKKQLSSGEMEIVGSFKSEGESYKVLGGCALEGCYIGLGNFYTAHHVGYANTDTGFLGCASEEIAKHFSRYFGMLITEAKYGDVPDFELLTERKP